MDKPMKPASTLQVGTEFYKGSYWYRVVGTEHRTDKVVIYAQIWYQYGTRTWPTMFMFKNDEQIWMRK